MDLTGRVVFISGASSGVGAAIARALAARGVRVLLGARRFAALDALAGSLGYWPHAAARVVDVRNELAVQAFIDDGAAAFGHLDAVVINAGCDGAAEPRPDGPNRWQAMLMTNVYGAAFTVRHATRPLLRSAEPHIVLTQRQPEYGMTSGGRAADPTTMLAHDVLEDELRRATAHAIRVTRMQRPLANTAIPARAEDLARAVVDAIEQSPRPTVDRDGHRLHPITSERCADPGGLCEPRIRA